MEGFSQKETKRTKEGVSTNGRDKVAGAPPLRMRPGAVALLWLEGNEGGARMARIFTKVMEFVVHSFSVPRVAQPPRYGLETCARKTAWLVCAEVALQAGGAHAEAVNYKR